ncbi:MAG: sensor histidine kinase [Planctomycetota bacterium]|jgi:signal transduction histidine kinase
MEPDQIDSRLLQRAHWLIRLRWIAVVCVAAATYVFGNVVGIAMHSTALYWIAAVLAIYNLGVFLLLHWLGRVNDQVSRSTVKKIINVQICTDLLILTILLHFSGGVENPFVFFFIFHMIIAGILLSVPESYLQATFAVLLFGLLAFLEYFGILPHYCLTGFISRCSHNEKPFVLGVFFVFALTLYLVVYMSTYIAIRLKRAEQAAREANEQLREKDRIKDEYVYRVTHDIKGHVAAIQSCLSLVVKKTIGKVEGKAEEFVGRAHTRTGKLGNFVRTLLELTEMRLGGRLQMVPFSLRKTVEHAVAFVEHRANEKSVTLNCHLPESELQILGNEFSVEEVVTNLLLNAIKYTPGQGSVTVNVKNQADAAVIEISDTGIGIPENEIGKVFDEFFRATNARKVERDGTGLGLSIAKYIVERHGGTIEVTSEKDKGTKFTITLPKDDGPA